MKKACGIFLVLALITLMAACAASTPSDTRDTADDSKNSLPESVVMLDTGKWPQNEYTEDISGPESGRVFQGWIDPEFHRCYIDMTGVSSETMESWYGLLLKDGFIEVGKTAEEIKGQHYTSTNALLQKDGVSVSMTHLSTAEGNLGICITKAE